jgi:chemotaxis signal transduction protein
MTQPGSGDRSLVVFPIRKQRFALDSRVLRELAPPVRLHKFPHTSQAIVGVIVRRGQIIPVYDAGSLLIGRPSTIHRFYLIFQCDPENPDELSAIPIDGECALASAAVEPSTDERAYVSGMAKVEDDWLPVLDFAALIAGSNTRTGSAATTEVRS